MDKEIYKMINQEVNPNDPQILEKYLKTLNALLTISISSTNKDFNCGIFAMNILKELGQLPGYCGD